MYLFYNFYIHACIFIFQLQETYGEDPYLSGVYATQFVKGLQGDHYRYVRANAGCKHFDAYAGPENIPSSRVSFDAQVCICIIHYYFENLFVSIQSVYEAVSITMFE